MLHLNQEELAAALDRGRGTVSEATKKGNLCAGIPVREYAHWDRNGRVSGYLIPERLIGEEARKRIEQFREWKALKP